MQKLRKAWELSGEERLLLLKVLALFPLVCLGVRLLPFRTLVSLLPKKRPSEGKARGSVLDSAERIAYLVEVASRHHFLKPSCLENGLILSGLLNNRGFESNLKIGTYKTNGKFEAHAWVEHQGRVILGGPVERYAPLLSAEAVGSQRQLA